MNDNKIIELTKEISINFIDCVKVSSSSFYKYNVSYLNDNKKNDVYFDKKLDVSKLDKEKLTEQLKNINGPNEILLKASNFEIKENSSKTLSVKDTGEEDKKSNENPIKSQTSGVDESRSRVNYSYNFNNIEKIIDALNAIDNINSCKFDTHFRFLSYNLDDYKVSNKYSKGISGLEDVTNKLKAKGGIGGFEEEKNRYSEVFYTISKKITETWAYEEALKREKNQISIPIEYIELCKSKGLNVEEVTNTYFKEYDAIIAQAQSGKITDYRVLCSLVGSLNASVSHTTVDEAEQILGSYANNGTEENKEALDKLYEQVAKITPMTRENFNKIISIPSKRRELAEMLSNASAENIVNGINGEESNGGISNEFFAEIENEYYKSEEGQQYIYDKWIDGYKITTDPENRHANTEYLKYLSSIGKEEWIISELKALFSAVEKISSDASFTLKNQIDQENNKELYDFILEHKSEYGNLPYGYIEETDANGNKTYYQLSYNRRGEALLYYTDTHFGEEKGEVKFKTAFSSQASMEATQTSHKSMWIDKRTKDLVEKGNDESTAKKQAERDYNIINGLEKDEKRKEELENENYVSFEEYIEQTGKANMSLIDVATEEVYEKIERDVKYLKQMKNSKTFNSNENKDLFTTGDVSLDAELMQNAPLAVGGIQLATGAAKSIENMIDAARMALNSDFVRSNSLVPGMYTEELKFSENMEINENYAKMSNKFWNEFYNSKMYKRQYDEFSKSVSGLKNAENFVKKLYYNNDFNCYMIGDGKKYFSYLDIPLSFREQTINDVMPEIFKNYKMYEWSLNDSSSSSQYIAAFKKGVRQGGDFEVFNNLSDTIKQNAKAQFETMDDVEVDVVGNWVNNNIYNEEWYKLLESNSAIKHDNLLGMAINQVGNMALPVALSLVPGVGQVLSSGALFTSAFGGASEEALLSGAGYNEALKYSTLSASTELLIEKAFGGIQGYGVGSLDEYLSYFPDKILNNLHLDDNVSAQIAKKLIINGFGEGIEEVVTDFVTPLWQSISYLSEKSYKDLLLENVSVESEAQTFLVSFLSSLVFGGINISGKINNFNKQYNNLTTLIGDIPGMSETANKILAEVISNDELNYNKSNMIIRMIELSSNELANNPESASAIKALQSKLKSASTELQNSYVKLQIKNNEIKIPKSVVISVTDILGMDAGYTIIDGNLFFDNDKKKNEFLSALYEDAINQLNRELVKNVINKEILYSKFNDLSFAIRTISESLNPVENIENVIIEINGEDISIPKNVVEEIISSPNIDENNRLILDEGVTIDDFVAGIKEHAKVIVENGINSNLYANVGDSNSIVQQVKDVNEQIDKNSNSIIKLKEDLSSKSYTNISEAIDLTKDNNLSIPPKIIVTDSTTVNNQKLVKLEVQAVVEGKQKQVNVYVDSTSDDILFNKDSKVADKIYEIIEQNKDSENVYIGEVKYNEKEKEVNITQNDANKAFVYYLNTSVISSVATTNTKVATTSHVKVNNNKELVEIKENGNSDKVQNIIDISKINLLFDNLIRQMNDFVKTLKEDYQKIVNNKNISKQTLEKIKLEQYQKFKEKINSYVQRINEIKNNSLDAIDNILSKLDDKSILKKFYEEQRRKLIDIFQNKSNKFISNAEDNYEKAVSTITFSPTQLYIDALDDVEISSNESEVIDQIKNENEKNIVGYTVEDLKTNNVGAKENINMDIISDTFEVKTRVDNSQILEPITIETSFIHEILKSNDKFSKALLNKSKYSPLVVRDAVIQYIDYIIENGIDLDINENIRKYYEAYKNASTNNQVIVNENSIIMDGKAAITISQELYNKYFIEKGDNNRFGYTDKRVLFNDLIKSIESLEYFEYMLATFQKDILLLKKLISDETILKELDKYSNFKILQDVFLQIDESAEKHIKSGDFIWNVHEIIFNNQQFKFLPKMINNTYTKQVYEFLSDFDKLVKYANDTKSPDEFDLQLFSAMKTVEMMSKTLDIKLDKRVINVVNGLYQQNITNIVRISIEDKLPQVYEDYRSIFEENNNPKKTVKKLEEMGYTHEEVATAILSFASRICDYSFSRTLYNEAYKYLIKKRYNKMDAATKVFEIYEELLRLRGYDIIITEEGLKIHIQKGINWNNQAYDPVYIQSEIRKLKEIYKTNIPVDIYVYDTFNPADKSWELEYKIKDFKSAATGGNNMINIYANDKKSSEVLSHEYGHLIDTQIMQDIGKEGRFSETQEWLNAIKADPEYPSEYAKTNEVEDFAESIAKMEKDPKKFKDMFPNRYKVLSKYIIVNENGGAVTVDKGEKIDKNILTDVIIEDAEISLSKHNHYDDSKNKSNITIPDNFNETIETKEITVPQIQNVKQLSIIDNIKHSLQRVNDKFTGYKLNTESYYERTTKANNKLFKQKQINKTFRDFANKHLIDLQTLKDSGLLKNPVINEINPLITNNRVLSSIEDTNISIANIVGVSKNIDLDRNFNFLFNEEGTEFQTRSIELLKYTNDQILNVLSESFKTHPIVISEVDTGKYIIEDNGYHRYSLLRLHYLNEYIKVKNNPELVKELNKKYTIPVKVYKLDTTKTYCMSILKELGIDVIVKTNPVTKVSTIFIDGKKVTMNVNELIEYTRNIINSDTNSSQVINKLLSEYESFREFYNKYLASKTSDYGINFNVESINQSTQIEVSNKTYALASIINILENKYLELIKGRTIDGINVQNMFSIFNKAFEIYPELKNKYKSNYDNIIDIFKTKYVHENGNLYPKTFNFVKTEEIIDVLRQPYKIQRYSKEKIIQLNKAINEYIEYASSNNYDLTPKEYKGYTKLLDLMSKEAPNMKLTSEVKSSLLNEFRRNEVKGGTFGSKQSVIRLLLEKNGVTNAINYLFNKDGECINFLEQINGFTDEDFQDLLDNVVDETGKLDGLYNLYDEIELFDLMRRNFDGIEDLEIIKFLYLLESTEAGAKGICNYSVAVNMIFNKYLGKETQFKVDFGYPMYTIKNGKKVLNDMMLLVDMYSIINEEVFTKKVNGLVKVIATNNRNYLPATNVGGSFNINNLNKFLNKKGIKLNLNQTFKFDSRFDSMWKEEILSNVKRALEDGETVNLSAAGFDLYRKDGKTLAAKDYEGHAMTVVGITKNGNLIVDSHGREMVVNLDLTLENIGKVYIDKNGKINTRRIGITTYSFNSSITSHDQNSEINDDLNVQQDEGFLNIFSKAPSDLDKFKEVLLTGDISTLSNDEINILIDYIKKGKIKLKDYNLNSDTIGIIIDKVPLQKIFTLSNVKAVKTFIEYFGKDTLVEFDKLNNNFLLGNNAENLYNLFDYYDLSIPKTNEIDKLKELNNLITSVINSNKKTDLRTYTFNYSNLIGTEYERIHPEIFIDEDAPQDLKDAFYNGLVNSSNEYKPEWSKYLEGKSIKGVIHEALISFENTKVIENINTIGKASSKYKNDLEDLANRVGMTIEEVQDILSSKLKYLIDNSEFGVRRTLKSLDSILESGKIKNQFEVNHTSYGVNSTDMRMDMEKDMFGIPRNIKYEDRPIYGMLLPKDLASKYVQKGPGAYYSEGNGVIYIFDKSKIMESTTLTLGDSLDQAGKICATNLTNPKYFGMFSEMLSNIKTKEDLNNFDFTSLYNKSIMEVGNSAYYEFQLHKEQSHTLDNLKEIIFLKNPEAKIIEKLKELNISWRVIK